MALKIAATEADLKYWQYVESKVKDPEPAGCASFDDWLRKHREYEQSWAKSSSELALSTARSRIESARLALGSAANYYGSPSVDDLRYTVGQVTSDEDLGIPSDEVITEICKETLDMLVEKPETQKPEKIGTTTPATANAPVDTNRSIQSATANANIPPTRANYLVDGQPSELRGGKFERVEQHKTKPLGLPKPLPSGR